MRRLLTLSLLFVFAIPFGASLTGCHHATAPDYCDGNDSGPVVGQATVINLNPRLTGYSINQGEIANLETPDASDCRGSAVSITAYTYASQNINLLDVEPTNGRICAGSWNRNTGGGIPDYTVCTPNGLSGVTEVTASAAGVTSNAVPVYVHPIVASITLGLPPSDCTTDPASDCIDLAVSPTCQATPVNVTNAPSYAGTSCLSQGQTGQLVARSLDANGNNISCEVGPLTFTPVTPSVAQIDQNGVVTALQPGSSLVTAATSLATADNAGFVSTCPPASITLNTTGQTTLPTAPFTVSQNVQQNLSATVIDTAGKPITNLDLTYVSTTPVTVPVAGSIVTPTYPGAATLTALCQPPLCNSSPFDQIGLFGNGLTVTSNPLQINAVGTGNSTVLYIASTNSQYLQPYDFTVTTQPAPIRLPYAPNSLQISTDLSTIYMGNANELMVLSTFSNALTRQDTSVSGTVLAVSPDSQTVVITDPVRKLIYLYNGPGGTVTTEYGGVATRAVWSPDSQTVYITTNDGRLLVYSTFIGWTPVALPAVATDLAVTVPTEGVYLAGNPVIARTDCPATTVANTPPFPTTTNIFYPQADVTTASATNLAATNNGIHILGATPQSFTDITTNSKSGACPVPFTSTTGPALSLAALAASSITAVLPTSDSAYAFVTYNPSTPTPTTPIPNGVVPQYAPATATLTLIPLKAVAGDGTPTAPVAGVISSDNNTFYVGTSGDNLVHLLLRTPTGFTDTGTPLTPQLPPLTGTTPATPNLLVQHPRKATS